MESIEEAYHFSQEDQEKLNKRQEHKQRGRYGRLQRGETFTGGRTNSDPSKGNLEWKEVIIGENTGISSRELD